jgi:predicted LPLAT superfamily acyltransferase
VHILLGLGAFCGLGAAIYPRMLWPVYAAMTILGVCISFVITPVILATIYFGLFTPLALFFRLRGRDPMQRRFEPDAATYWLPHRDVTRPRAPASYLRLY